MIYLGFDHVRLQTVARYKDQRLILQETERAHKIIDALYATGKDGPRMPYDTEIRMVICEIPYSDQAWSDLRSIAQ